MGHDVLTLGEVLSVFVPDDGLPFRRSQSVNRITAGAEANVAVAVARLGLRAGFLGRVGSDLGGEAVLDDMRREGLDVDHVIIDATAPTGAIIREATSAGANVSYLRAGSAGSHLDLEDLPLDVIARARAIHVSGVTTALSNSARVAARNAIAHAREHGVLTSFDLNFRSRLWSADVAGPILKEFAAGHNLLVGGIDEMLMTFGSSDPDRIRQMTGSGMVVITDGAGPVLVADATDVWQEAVPVVPVVDVVGAGDALVGGTLAGTLSGLTNQLAVRQGIRCGSSVVQNLGDWTGLPWGRDGVLPHFGPEVSR